MILLLIVMCDNGFSTGDLNFSEWEERIEYPVVDGKVEGMSINNFIHAKKFSFKRGYEENNYGAHTIIKGYLVKEVVYYILEDFAGEVDSDGHII